MDGFAVETKTWRKTDADTVAKMTRTKLKRVLL